MPEEAFQTRDARKKYQSTFIAMDETAERELCERIEAIKSAQMSIEGLSREASGELIKIATDGTPDMKGSAAKQLVGAGLLDAQGRFTHPSIKLLVSNALAVKAQAE